jgi:hypothetical protein
MAKWLIVLAIIILAPTFVINAMTNGVNFVSSQGKALFSEVAKEAAKTVQEANK